MAHKFLKMAHRFFFPQLFATWVIFLIFLSPAVVFFKIMFFLNVSGIPSECQKDWIQIRPDVLSGQIWVQSVCKGYQQTTRGGKDNNLSIFESGNAG